MIAENIKVVVLLTSIETAIPVVIDPALPFLQLVLSISPLPFPFII
jgi:hypothetical protein